MRKIGATFLPYFLSFMLTNPPYEFYSFIKMDKQEWNASNTAKRDLLRTYLSFFLPFPQPCSMSHEKNNLN